ncbi:type 1 glutamine amidotransferase domain-containing protein [Lacibacter sediminis]|uniref:Type 1 glutamine amidotransferase domain-containing protein n=1 Tax=Lacibacter sediminis TaxID=2760713 RepID=A0A7G5XIF6_9BACT|nr:type 1 glutamine amidotransferase domain-containing protein [Lacibacter sediminis]QNA45259.1 type 1 glutamine amidotransferase domain-containing protein [Lacibacter sediminis]
MNRFNPHAFPLFMKITIALIVTAFSNCFCFSQGKKILIVSTNIDSIAGNKSGTYLKEIAWPFKVFTDNGFTVEVMTAKGGKASIYHSGDMPEALAQIQNSASFINATLNTLPPEKIRVADYAAVYYPGGHGQYFDVLSDERIATIAVAIHSNGGVLAAAGHGMSSWINILLPDGDYLVKGKTITCFPTWAEKEWMSISAYGKLLPFDMEEVFRRRGARLIVPEKNSIKDPAFTNITDTQNKIVTGSFAFNAQWVAEMVVALIKTQSL